MRARTAATRSLSSLSIGAIAISAASVSRYRASPAQTSSAHTSAHQASFYPSAQSDGDGEAAAGLELDTVRVKEIGAAAGADPRHLDPLGAQAGGHQLRLIRRGDVEPHRLAPAI